jgi:hypothetical protein
MSDMSTQFNFKASKLQAFDGTYDTKHEDIAAQVRGEFLEKFPITSLPLMKRDDYVIGLQSPTFCAHVEAKTRPWANIQGATSNKFGIYFGKTKTDPEKKYRFTHKFGETSDEAFSSVKAALLALVRLGEASVLDFSKIDDNPLSQMFKAKILSLYFPDKFLNVCSAEHLEMLGSELGYADGRPISEYQYLLLKAKLSNAITRKWSNPKFMKFLYDEYVRAGSAVTNIVQKPRLKLHQKVNFEDISKQRDAIGKAAEEFAVEWERQRLAGAELSHLISKIDDRRDRPGYGYDFLSHTSQTEQRYIEVKSVGKLPGGQGHRFFLSENEYVVSKSVDYRDAYFFYLVFFNGNGQPFELQPIRADEFYKLGEMSPASYVVRFDCGRAGN